MLTTVALALLAAMAPPAPAPEVAALPLARVSSVAALGSQLVITCGPTTYLVEAATVRLDGDALVLDGSYTSLSSAPNVLTTEYADQWGVRHKIVTDCNGLTRAACWDAHYKMVELSKSVFPPAPVPEPAK